MPIEALITANYPLNRYSQPTTEEEGDSRAIKGTTAMHTSQFFNTPPTTRIQATDPQ